ncbi:hypothetical protein TRV_02576 [Trichophyton verrucosum HKI 0517]|uniref:Luciferase domain-containing protein n=1 Tax=Trichophyton verrucosum (strain HKI 0517) TaxID=663202 RepID=D4D653_TRIVH|nr:uncharacterized protein TRV_02576 [Trichophyton verrucosum HKI 0517]EFE42624.1 hypothetical protein TRV_02576 [Trichophyton verrucosum HKI 0517]
MQWSFTFPPVDFRIQVDMENAPVHTNVYAPFFSLMIWLASTLVAVLLFRRVRAGYLEFLSLGPGGTPSTPMGYLRTGILKYLPTRTGKRPKVAGIIPHRQVTQQATPDMYAALKEEIKKLALSNSDRLYEGTSCFEKHSIGLFTPLDLPNRVTCNGEICHAHPIDGSIHMTLHPADVKFVIERGWGERHPLARDSWWWMFRLVPTGFVMIYAPRSKEELDSVVQIIHAASWWVNGIEPRWSTPANSSRCGVDGGAGFIKSQVRT